MISVPKWRVRFIRLSMTSPTDLNQSHGRTNPIALLAFNILNLRLKHNSPLSFIKWQGARKRSEPNQLWRSCAQPSPPSSIIARICETRNYFRKPILLTYIFKTLQCLHSKHQRKLSHDGCHIVEFELVKHEDPREWTKGHKWFVWTFLWSWDKIMSRRGLTVAIGSSIVTGDSPGSNSGITLLLPYIKNTWLDEWLAWSLRFCTRSAINGVRDRWQPRCDRGLELEANMFLATSHESILVITVI